MRYINLHLHYITLHSKPDESDQYPKLNWTFKRTCCVLCAALAHSQPQCTTAQRKFYTFKWFWDVWWRSPFYVHILSISFPPTLCYLFLSLSFPSFLLSSLSFSWSLSSLVNFAFSIINNNRNNKLCTWRHNMPPPLSSHRRPSASCAAEQTQRSSTFPHRIRSHAHRGSRLTRVKSKLSKTA